MAKKPAAEVEVEIIPPAYAPPPKAGPTAPPEPGPKVYVKSEGAAPQKEEAPPFDDPFIALVSKLMDSVFVIPGTGIRFGLDPIIGLFAGYGDAAASMTSLYLLVRSAAYGLPKIVIAQMALNIVINGTIGAIPVFGDLFSFWFKSNDRNYALLRKYASSKKESTLSNWLFVLAVLAGVAGILVLTVIGYASMIILLIKALRGGN